MTITYIICCFLRKYETPIKSCVEAFRGSTGWILLHTLSSTHTRLEKTNWQTDWRAFYSGDERKKYRKTTAKKIPAICLKALKWCPGVCKKWAKNLTAAALKVIYQKKTHLKTPPEHLECDSVIPAEHSTPFVLTDAFVIVSLLQYISAACRWRVLN